MRELELALGYWFAPWLTVGLEGGVGMDFTDLAGIEQILSTRGGLYEQRYTDDPTDAIEN